jgi:AcrR family transcriptional regulator
VREGLGADQVRFLGFIASGKLNVPVLEITQAADVGMGSFYNHFDSKEELFEAAVADVLDTHGALLDQLTEYIEDPAETFACSFRLTGRLFRRRPQESRILLANGLNLMASKRGLGPRAMRDIELATAAGRFTVDDPKLALAVAAGALLGARQAAAGRAGTRPCCGRRPGDRRRAAVVRTSRRRSSRNLPASASGHHRGALPDSPA